MSFEEFKDAWQAQQTGHPASIDPNLLLAEVRHNQRKFQATIVWRDVREIGVALVMIPIWLGMGITMKLPWTWYLCIPALIWVAGFLYVDRRRHKRPSAPGGESIREYVEACTADVEHQIWLIRNVLWWYLLPIAIPVMAFVAEVSWRTREGGWISLLAFAVATMICLIVFGAIYWINQSAIRTYLEPLREELGTLRKSLEDETGGATESQTDQ